MILKELVDFSERILSAKKGIAGLRNVVYQPLHRTCRQKQFMRLRVPGGVFGGDGGKYDTGDYPGIPFLFTQIFTRSIGKFSALGEEGGFKIKLLFL